MDRGEVCSRHDETKLEIGVVGYCLEYWPLQKVLRADSGDSKYTSFHCVAIGDQLPASLISNAALSGQFNNRSSVDKSFTKPALVFAC